MKATYYLIKASFQKEIKELIRYKFDTITNIVTFYILFVAMFSGLKFFGNSMKASSVFMDESLQGFVIGYFLWTIMYMAYADTAYSITNDSSTGTLEQIAMSHLGLGRVLITRSIANILINIASCFIVLIAIMNTTGYWLEGNLLASVVPIFLGVFSILGLGLIFGGLALIFKRVKSILNLVQYFLIALVFPQGGGEQILINLLVPFRPSILAVYGITTGQISLLELPPLYYLLMLGNSLVYFSIGMLFFKQCTRLAKKRGLMGQY